MSAPLMPEELAELRRYAEALPNTRFELTAARMETPISRVTLGRVVATIDEIALERDAARKLLYATLDTISLKDEPTAAEQSGSDEWIGTPV